MSGNKLTKAEPTGVANYDAELAALYASAAGSNEGLENIGREDTALPFLKILQALSPEVTRGKDQYIQGAQAGEFINSLTNERWDGEKGVEAIRVYFEKKYIEWKPRDSGGGLVRISSTLDEAQAHKVPDTGNAEIDTTIDETHQLYLLVRGKFGLYPVLLSLTKSKLPFSRKWNATAMGVRFGEFEGDPVAAKLPAEAQPKSFAVVYTLTTGTKQGKKGTYFVPQLGGKKRLAAADELKAAMDFANVVKSGGAKVEYKAPDAEDAEAIPGAGVDGAV